MNDEPTLSRPSGPERGDAARARLIEAAIKVFGLLGFEGASTRAVAKAAGVNLQAISYYFGGKDSLYLAVADHILERITAYLGPTRDRVRARLAEARSGGPAIARRGGARAADRNSLGHGGSVRRQGVGELGAVHDPRADAADRGLPSALRRPDGADARSAARR